jgi:hypothetical protein
MAADSTAGATFACYADTGDRLVPALWRSVDRLCSHQAGGLSIVDTVLWDGTAADDPSGLQASNSGDVIEIRA